MIGPEFFTYNCALYGNWCTKEERYIAIFAVLYLIMTMFFILKNAKGVK